MARKGENIRKRKDGRWEGRYYLPKAAGNVKVCSVYARSYSQVKEKLFLAKLSVLNTNEISQERTKSVFLSEAALKWLETISASKKYSTYIKYKTIYEKYLAEPLQDIIVSEINNAMINEKIFSQKGNWSESLKRSIYTVLSQILKYASEQYKEPIINLEKKLDYKRTKIEILNHTEQAQLLQYLYANMNLRNLGILLCLSTGLRLGEICSLKWTDIDYQFKVLHVRTTVQRLAVEGKEAKTLLIEDKPKSKCSEREIPLSDAILLLLNKFPQDTTYLLNSNKPMDPRTYQYVWKACLQKAGIENKNFHSLRHTFATNCLNSGADIKSLSEIMGHSSVQITLNRYVHPALEVKRKYLNSLSDTYLDYVKM